MTTAVATVTADELLRLPDDGWRYELVEGELRRMSPPGHSHGRVAMNLGWRLAQIASAQRLGTVYAAETGFVISRNPDTVRAPDVAFVAATRAASVADETGYFPGPPDLAVEVVSPGDTFTEVEDKVFVWLAAGTQAVVVLDPRRRSAALYRAKDDIRQLADDETLDLSFVVPGFTVAVADLFE
jgi:Uma2 family endonuclease